MINVNAMRAASQDNRRIVGNKVQTMEAQDTAVEINHDVWACNDDAVVASSVVVWSSKSDCVTVPMGHRFDLLFHSPYGSKCSDKSPPARGWRLTVDRPIEWNVVHSGRKWMIQFLLFFYILDRFNPNKIHIVCCVFCFDTRWL